MSMSGDGDGDDAAAMGLIPPERPWTLPAWHLDPDQLVAQARALNLSAFASAAAGATRHSDPPTNPAMRSC
jgi:hypothetical protein